MSDGADARTPEEAALDRALAELPRPAVDPLWSRSARLAAERRLSARPHASSRIARLEPVLLVAMSVLQLLWAAARVFVFAR